MDGNCMNCGESGNWCTCDELPGHPGCKDTRVHCLCPNCGERSHAVELGVQLIGCHSYTHLVENHPFLT